MELFLDQFLNLEIMRQAAPLLLRGLGMTALLSAAVVPLGLAGALVVALVCLSLWRAARWPAFVTVDFFRAALPLSLLLFVYPGPPFVRLRLPPFAAVCLAFVLNTGSYYGEIDRAGIESIGKGQWEAARSTGFSATQTLAWVVIPQAVRNVLPDLVSNTVEVVKLTSIASVVALPELLYSADMARSLTYNPSPIVAAAAIYLAVLWPCVRLLSRLEHRVGR